MDILFVLGSARSGTTLVSKLLRDHFDYGMAAEGHWVTRLGTKLHTFGDLNDEQNLKRLVKEVVDSPAMQIFRDFYPERLGWDVDITEEIVMSHLKEPTYAGVVYAGFAAVADQMRKPRVGNKDPGYTLHLPFLHRLFPKSAKFLNVMRDGRDVALSTMKMPWGPNSAFACADEWLEACEAVDRFAGTPDPDQFLEIRYEDLLTDPRSTCRTLEQFLDVDLGAEGRDRFVAVFEDSPMRDNFGKWKTKMSERERRHFEAQAGDWLQRKGYDLSVPGARLRPWERPWYMGLDFIRRVKRAIIVRYFPQFKGD